MQYATGTYDRILRTEQTDQYPWLLQEGKTYIERDEDNELYGESCNFYRDFVTTYSNIRLKGSSLYRVNLGYKLYDSWLDATVPLYFGHKLNYEFQVIDVFEEGAISSLIGLTATGLAAVMAVLAF